MGRREVRLVPVDHDGSGHRCDVFGRHPQELVRVQPEPVYHGQVGGYRQDLLIALGRGRPGDGASDRALTLSSRASNRGLVHRPSTSSRLLELCGPPGSLAPPVAHVSPSNRLCDQRIAGAYWIPPSERGRSGFQRGKSGSRSWRRSADPVVACAEGVVIGLTVVTGGCRTACIQVPASGLVAVPRPRSRSVACKRLGRLFRRPLR